jgi:NADPH:quinone reductase-like Zn-dependent oxidoreductase
LSLDGRKLTALASNSNLDNVAALDVEIPQLLNANKFNDIRRISFSASPTLRSAFLAKTETDVSFQPTVRAIHLLHFSPNTEVGRRIKIGLEKRGWEIVEHEYPFNEPEFDGTILILDDLSSSVLSTIGDGHWAALQALSTLRNRILWVTEGSQFEVTKPENAMIHGLVRTIRDEDPSINFTTLDVENSLGEHTIPTIHILLESLQTSTFKKSADYEFAERHGIIYISRVFPDYPMNKFTKEERYGAELVTQSLHDTDSRIRLICERVGSVDSLKFTEVGSKELYLRDNEIEIEIAAAGLNFKDIAISTGLIPGDQRLLGYEGAGTIIRSESTLYRSEQRVLFIKPGSFANRIIAKAELVHPIPDSMSFEEAATLGAVYPVALYSLFDMANTRRGQRVLIHSAAGGIGISCIQVCQYIGAEVYATVGSDEKRKFLVDTFEIPSSKIFNSRSTVFAAELMDATNSEGVDVIINSLTGDLLEESWHCIRDGGTMVELGKKDILERNYLPMEPFSRNVSYRSLDISHKSVPESVLSR